MNQHQRCQHHSGTNIHIGICTAAIILYLSACSFQPQPEQHNPAQDTRQSSSTQITAEPLPVYGGDPLHFEEGHYSRDEHCARVFDYQETTYGPLTIAIEENGTGPADLRSLASEIVDLYLSLYEHSPIPFDSPVTVYIVADPQKGACHSTDHLVFTAPEALGTKLFSEDLLGAATGIKAYWIKVGLAALATGEQPDQDILSEWYQTTDDPDMAGLFIARFNEAWTSAEERDIARISAASLLQYALEEEHIPPDLLIERVDNGVRTRWMGSIGVEREVTYPYDSHFSGFDYSQSEDCNLIVEAKNLHFCLNAQPGQEYLDEVSEVEFLIDHTFYGRKALIDYIQSNAPSVSHLMNADEKIQIEVVDFPGPGGVTLINTIKLKVSGVLFAPLHEMVHTFEWNNVLLHKQEYWLLEGTAEYLGKLLPIYQQTEKQAIFEDLKGRELSEGVSYWYNLDEEQLVAAKAWYLAQGGELGTQEIVDPRLFTDAVAFATLYRDALGLRGYPLGAKLEILHPNFDQTGLDGMELSYTQAASFTAWLSDTYSLDRVLDVYVNQAENGKLDGKSYEDLKAEWLSDLRSRGQTIPIPDQP